jgi:dTDP-4-dehydrorhamnose 3,5-epimerase
MKIIETRFPDLFIIQPKVWGDNRGFFFESFNAKVLAESGITYKFVQDNHSKSSFGVLRGLHYQKGIYAQTKLVRVTRGSVIDVVVDLRQGSPTYLEHYAIELSEDNHTQLLIPKGFAHGFVVLSETAEFLYKCDQFYNKESEGGLHFADPELNIDWGLQDHQYIVNDKDLSNPLLADADFDFPFQEFTESKLYA